MGFIVAGVNTREIKRADKNNSTILSKSAYYPYLHRYRKLSTERNFGSQKHVSDDTYTDRPNVSLKKHKGSITAHTETADEVQKRLDRELNVVSRKQFLRPAIFLELPDEIIDQVMLMSGRNSNLPILNKQLYAYFNQSDIHARMMNQFVKFNYTRDNGATMVFDLRVFNCKRCRDYLMDVGLVRAGETKIDVFKRAESMSYIFNKPISSFINEEGTRKDPKSGSEVSFLVENSFPEYFLKNEDDFQKYFVPFLKETKQNAVFEKIMENPLTKVILNHPETVINMLITKTYETLSEGDQMREMFMKVRNLAISETEQQYVSDFHLSATPLVLAVQRHGKHKDKIHGLLQSLLHLYEETHNTESLSDDTLWFLLISDSKLQLPNEMIWNAGGRPSAAVMNNFI
ncbi:hypothetical protein ACO0RG_001737 [Hanseniaspora osmophila]